MISIKDIIQSSSNHFTDHFIATKTYFNKKKKILKDFTKENTA